MPHARRRDRAAQRPLAIDPARARGGLPRVAHIPETSLFRNLEISARRYPAKTAIQFFGNAVRYAQLLAEVEPMAGYLQRECGWRRATA